jgi:hypothetical protein
MRQVNQRHPDSLLDLWCKEGVTMADVINKVISFITGDNEGGDDKQILLRQLAREIQQNKYAKFYRPRQEEADPSLAQYFYSIYKIVYPARKFLRDPDTIARIKRIILESYLDKETMNVLKRITPEAIEERKKSAGAELSKQLEDDLLALAKGFDSPRLAAADKCYRLVTIFNNFVFWDYYSFLKKFDPELPEDNFTEAPKFTAQRADIIMADLASFLAVLPPFDISGITAGGETGAPKADWKTVFEVFKYCRNGQELIKQGLWDSLIVNLKDLKNSLMINSMIRLASRNPVWELKATPVQEEPLSALYLDHKTAEVRQAILDITGKQRNAQIIALEKAVFNASDVTRLNFYIKKKSAVLSEKDVEPYLYAPALNHLLAFIQDFLSKELAELCDIILVRGQWTKNAASIAMSDGYHNVIDISPEITKLDETLSEDGSNGPRLRGALVRLDRDRTQERYINSIVSGINEEALNLINKAVPSLIVVAKHIKMLMDDFQKKPYELIMNWKELGQVSKTPLLQRLSDSYKKLNYFVQLMLLETKKE